MDPFSQNYLSAAGDVINLTIFKKALNKEGELGLLPINKRWTPAKKSIKCLSVENKVVVQTKCTDNLNVVCERSVAKHSQEYALRRMVDEKTRVGLTTTYILYTILN